MHTIYSVYISTFDQLTLVNVIFGNTNIFEYFWHEYLFRHSFVSDFLKRINSDIHSYKNIYTNIFGYSFVSKKLCEYIRIFIRVKNLKRIYSDIRSSPNFDECHTLIWKMVWGLITTLHSKNQSMSENWLGMQISKFRYADIEF